MKEERALGIADSERLSFDLGVDVAVDDEEVGPAVVVVVEKLCAKTKIGSADGSDTRGARDIGELAVVVVVVEVVGIVGEVGLDDVGPAIAIVVGGVDAHASLLAAITTVGDAGLDADLGESAFAVVVVEQAGRRVVGDVK